MGVLEFIGNVSNIAGAIGGAVAAIGVLKMLAVSNSQAERISVTLQLVGEGSSLYLPLELVRRDVARAEILGRLGMLPTKVKGARFSIRSLSSPEFVRALNEVVDGKTSTLVIPATREEVEQFDL